MAYNIEVVIFLKPVQLIVKSAQVKSSPVISYQMKITDIDSTRQYHPRRFERIGSTGDQRKHSFFVRTIKDWNDLPPDILGIDDYEAFKTSLIVHRRQ
jgi:hypothetical protein